MYEICFVELKNPLSRIACKDANRLAEKWTEIIQIMVAKIAPQFTMLPKFIVSISIYFKTIDWSSQMMDAFALPIPMWFVYIDFF